MLIYPLILDQMYSTVFLKCFKIFPFVNRKQDLESHERSGNEDSGDVSEEEEEEEEEEVGVVSSKT